MKLPASQAEASGSRRDLAAALAVAAVLACTGLWAYRDVFSAPFLFDDIPAVSENLSIRDLSHLETVLSPSLEEASGATGRPLVNLSLAINYALGGLRSEGYHGFNLAIHILAALVLFGIVRRTMAHIKGTKDPPTRVPAALGLGTALLFLLHPLQTESVVCVVQRTELLSGLFYLATLYGFIRLAEAGGEPSRFWSAFSVLSCLAGMASKETVVTAPLLVLFYDRTFVAGSFRHAWLQRRVYYGALASAWVLLAYLVIRSGGHRAGTAGFGLGVTPWAYALTQCRAVLLYLKLSVWPHPLVVDYGMDVVRSPAEVLPQALALVLLLGAAGIAFARRHALGFLGAAFFIVLGPSSSVVPLVSQTIAEHRMYLPLAALAGMAACGGSSLLDGRGRWARTAGLLVFLSVLATFGIMTSRRVAVFQSALSLWTDTVRSCPQNARAHSNLGSVLLGLPGHFDQAIAEFHQAIQLMPDYAPEHNNLGLAWYRTPGRMREAAEEFQEAVHIEPGYAPARTNLGNAWQTMPGRLDDAVAQYNEAIRLRPGYPEAHQGLGTVWLRVPGRLGEAIAEFREALRLDPNYAEAHSNLGVALSRTPGGLGEAVNEYREALRLKPDSAETHNSLGVALSRQPGRLDEAVAEYREALRLKPDYAEAHSNLGDAWMQSPGHTEDAMAEYRKALSLNPESPGIHGNLGVALARLPGRLDEAVAEYREALRLGPDSPETRNNLGNALSRMPGRLEEAVAEYREALRLRPDYPEAHNNLGSALSRTPSRLAEALAEFHEALRLRPDYADAHNNLGNALAGIPGRAEDAVQEYGQALRLNPDFAAAHFNLATALSGIPGRSAEAATHLVAYLRLRPNDEVARTMLVRIRGHDGPKP